MINDTVIHRNRNESIANWLEIPMLDERLAHTERVVYANCRRNTFRKSCLFHSTFHIWRDEYVGTNGESNFLRLEELQTMWRFPIHEHIFKRGIYCYVSERTRSSRFTWTKKRRKEKLRKSCNFHLMLFKVLTLLTVCMCVLCVCVR